MFERLPLELRQHIYTLHIENCTWIVREDRIPYAHHNQLQHFVPHKSALLTVNRRISAEFGEQLSRHTRTARLYFEFFDASVQCERESFSHVWREHDTTLSVMRGVRRVELIVRTDSEFRREVGDAVVDGVFDMLNYFKKVEQIYISVESDYVEEFDEDIEFSVSLYIRKGDDAILILGGSNPLLPKKSTVLESAFNRRGTLWSSAIFFARSRIALPIPCRRYFCNTVVLET